MGTLAVTNTFIDATAAEAAEVNENFTDVVTFVNDSVVHRDGSKAMTAAFDGGGFRVSNVGVGTAASDSGPLSQTGVADYEATGAGVTVTTGGATVDTISVTVPTAGTALLWVSGTVTLAAASGFSGFSYPILTVSVAGGTALTSATTNFDTNETNNVAVLFTVPLAAGANTFTVTGTRNNNGVTNGTLTADSGFRTAILGAF